MSNIKMIILNKFIEKYKGQSLSKISEVTKINRTRVFRIFNGSKMKLYEWEIFNKLINKQNHIFIEKYLELEEKSKEEINKDIERKNYLLKIKKR